MADWLEYDWTFEKKPAHVTVDMALINTERKLRPALVWCIFTSLNAEFSSTPAAADTRRLLKAEKTMVTRHAQGYAVRRKHTVRITA